MPSDESAEYGDGADRPAVCVDTLDYDGAETHQDSIEGESEPLLTDGGRAQDDGGTDRAGSRVSCAFCDLPSDYVLTVTDSAPDGMKIIEESLSLPVCRSHFEEMEESAI